ncbi:ABC transporter ATP-binding protein [bacterium]|nr:ABC transporter ATP-binding protein [bacterium]
MAESADLIIQAKGLTKKFGKRIAVNDISFSVQKGEILGFLGPNAAGKTTTMKMLTCFYPPTEGTAIVNGYDVVSDSYGVRRSIGYMPENVPLYVDMTVEEYLYFVAKAKSIPPADIKGAISKALERCNLTNVSNQLIATISRGYKQRVGLAQAIINDPPVLILDEPSVGLDPAQIKDFRELIVELGKSSTVILSTHILSEAQLICGRVCILDHGSIIAVDTPSNLSDRLQKSTALSVQLLASETDKVVEDLKKLEGVSGVEEVKRESLSGCEHPLLSFKVEIAKTDLLVRKAINVLAVEKDWTLYSMQADRLSLEDVFINLVKEHEEEISEESTSEAEIDLQKETEGEG